MRQTIGRSRYTMLWATIVSSCAAIACGEGLLDEPIPAKPPPRVFYSERFVQGGVSFTNPSLLVPDEAFEYRWVTSGAAGYVQVSLSGPAGLGAQTHLLFDIPAGCGTSQGVSVSSLPAGYGYGLYLTVGGADAPNTCSLPLGWIGTNWHAVDFSNLPVSPARLGDVTITRLVAP